MPRKSNFMITEGHDRKLQKIERRFGLAKSDTVRRAIDLIYDYLCNDKQPADSEAVRLEKTKSGG